MFALGDKELIKPRSFAMLSRSLSPWMLCVMMFHFRIKISRGLFMSYPFYPPRGDLVRNSQILPCLGVNTCLPNAISLAALLRMGVLTT